jgi:hypothetical protein
MRTVMMALLGTCLVAAPCWAQQPDGGREPVVSWGGEVTLSSAYLWRGEMDLRKPTLQPELWIGVGDLTIASWSALETGGLHEHDLSLTLERELAGVALSGGLINYFLPESEASHYENEVFAGIAYPARVTPSFSVWHGIGAGTADYMESAVSSRIPWRGLSIEPKLAAGYDRAASPAELTHIESTIAIAWQQPGYSIRPFISRITNLRSEGESHTAGGLLVVIGQ